MAPVPRYKHPLGHGAWRSPSPGHTPPLGAQSVHFWDTGSWASAPAPGGGDHVRPPVRPTGILTQLPPPPPPAFPSVTVICWSFSPRVSKICSFLAPWENFRPLGSRSHHFWSFGSSTPFQTLPLTSKKGLWEGVGGQGFTRAMAGHKLCLGLCDSVPTHREVWK